MAKSSDPEAEIANSQPNGADAASLKVKQSDEPTSKSADAGADRQEEEAGLRRLWFVRLPKPPEAPDVKALEIQVDTYKTQSSLLREGLNVKKLERDAVRVNVRSAREAMKRCREAYDAKMAEVEPLREALRNGGAASRKLREEFGDLEARTEAELDAKLAALNHRIEHESITLTEEKALVASIKKLKAQRPRIQEYQATAALAADGRADADRLRAELSDHEAELKVLRSERDTQGAILARYIEQESAVNAEVEANLAEIHRIKELQDAAYAKLSATRRTQRSRNDDHFANRRFSRSVRDALAAGRMEDAKALCAEQMETMHAKLAEDADFRKEYCELWEHQHAATAAAAAEEGLEGSAGEANGASAAAKKLTDAKPPVPKVDPAEKAQAIIASLLEKAATEAAAEDTAAAAPVPEASAAVQAPAANGKPPAMSKPAKKAAAPKYVAEPVVEPEDKFELPDAVKHKRAPSSEMTAAEKAAERERQRKAQEEAELKKQRREEQKRQKKEKALKAQEEAEAAAAAAAAAQAAAEAAALKAAAAAAEAEKEAEAAEDAAVAPVMKAASASKVPLPVVKAGAPKPTAKRPARRSQPVQVQLMAYVQEHQMVAAGLAVLLLALLVFRSFTAEPQF